MKITTILWIAGISLGVISLSAIPFFWGISWIFFLIFTLTVIADIIIIIVISNNENKIIEGAKKEEPRIPSVIDCRKEAEHQIKQEHFVEFKISPIVSRILTGGENDGLTKIYWYRNKDVEEGIWYDFISPAEHLSEAQIFKGLTLQEARKEIEKSAKIPFMMPETITERYNDGMGGVKVVQTERRPERHQALKELEKVAEIKKEQLGEEKKA